MACMHGTAARLTRPSHLLLLPHAGSADVYHTGSNCTGKHQSSSTGATHQAQPCLLLWPQLLLEGVRAKLNPRDLLVLEPPWEGAYGVGVPTLVAEKLVMLQLCCHLVQRGLHTNEAHMWGSGCTTIPTQMLPGSACQHCAGCDSLTRLCQSVQCGKRHSRMAADILKGHANGGTPLSIMSCCTRLGLRSIHSVRQQPASLAPQRAASSPSAVATLCMARWQARGP